MSTSWTGWQILDRRRQGPIGSWRAVWAGLALTAALSLPSGCGAGSDGTPGMQDSSTGSTTLPDAPAPPERRATSFIISPDAARSIGYRISWLAGGTSSLDAGIKLMEVQDDAVLILDDENILTRIRRDDGSRVWRSPVAQPIEEILGVTYLPAIGRIDLTMGGDLIVLDAATGGQLQRQKLTSIANTEPVVFGQFLIYGSRTGQLIWHNHELAFQWNAYQVAQSVQLPPVLRDGYLVTAGHDGRLMVLSAPAAAQLWATRLLDAIVAPPAVGNGAVYVGSLDQHLRAYDLGSGRSLWSTLTESPLTEPPILIGDRLFLQIPSQGLFCFEALPANSKRGVVLWSAPEVTGSVLALHRSDLLVWDDQNRTLTMLTARDGTVVRTMKLDRVDRLLASRLDGAEIFAAADNGRIMRLVPRN